MATAEFARVPARVFPTSIEKTEKVKKLGVFEYRAFAGKEGSSPDNFVPVDWLFSRLADAFHFSDEDLKRK